MNMMNCGKQVHASGPFLDLQLRAPSSPPPFHSSRKEEWYSEKHVSFGTSLSSDSVLLLTTFGYFSWPFSTFVCLCLK